MSNSLSKAAQSALALVAEQVKARHIDDATTLEAMTVARADSKLRQARADLTAKFVAHDVKAFDCGPVPKEKGAAERKIGDGTLGTHAEFRAELLAIQIALLPAADRALVLRPANECNTDAEKAKRRDLYKNTVYNGLPHLLRRQLATIERKAAQAAAKQKAANGDKETAKGKEAGSAVAGTVAEISSQKTWAALALQQLQMLADSAAKAEPDEIGDVNLPLFTTLKVAMDAVLTRSGDAAEAKKVKVTFS